MDTSDSQSPFLIPDAATPLDPPATPGEGLDLHDPDTVIDLFDRAAQANMGHPQRSGAVVDLPRTGMLTMTGDLHDNGLNFSRILNIAALHTDPDHHVVLHEISHGEKLISGRDYSIRMLSRIAALKLQYPNQVHLIQANHDLAQLVGEGILKDGVSVVERFNEGVDFIYADDADEVRDALGGFIRSFLAAVRTENGVFCAHSLPSPRALDTFDPAVVERVPTDADLGRGGSIYKMVWGRNLTDAIADQLAERWGVKLFVLGHQPADMGYDVIGEKMVVLNSDHDHGVVMPIDLTKDYETLDELISLIVPLGSVIA